MDPLMTAAGEIRARYYDDGAARGMQVLVGGDIVCAADVPGDGEIRTVAYREGEDAPADVIPYNRGDAHGQ